MARILVVDDEPDIRAILRAILESENHEVLEADDGLSAYEIVRARSIDLVLLDAMMPGMDGYQLLEKLLGVEDFAAPVIMVTGRSDAEGMFMEMDAGAIDHIAKPFTLEEVRITVARMLELSGEDREERRRMLARSAATYEAMSELRGLLDDQDEAPKRKRFGLG